MTYHITVQPSGHVFDIEENEFILDAALRQGISFPYGCRSGSCGTCLGKVLSGEIAYPDGLPLTVMEHEHEQGKAVFCVSVAKSDLSLEIKELSSSTEIEIKQLPVRVESLRKLSSDVMEMSLKIPETERLAFRAGQYIEIILRDKSRKAFSIANSPSNDEFVELHLRHIEGGKFTGFVFNNMKEKAILRIEGPLGSFYIRENSNRPLILVAGGTGFAPIKAMVEKLIEESDTRPIYLYWGASTESGLYRNDLAEKWAFQHKHICYIPVLSEGSEDDWQGRTGFVHEAILNDFSDLSEYDVYIAGSPVMVNAARKGFFERSLPEEQLYSDSFEFAINDVDIEKAEKLV